MTPEAVLAELGTLSALEDLRLHWDESMAAMPKTFPEFLDEQRWKENRRRCGFGKELDESLGRVAAMTRENNALRALAWHCYWRTFLCPEPCPPNGWPEPEACLGDDRGLFYLLPAMAFVPLMRAAHRGWGFDEAVTWHTAQQVRRYCDDNYRRGSNGRPGIYLSQLGWLRHYTRERYVRLGRLEYWLGPCPYSIEVYRHRDTRHVVALAPNGTRFAADGTIPNDAADYVEGEGWTASLTHTENAVSGYLINPRGIGTKHEVTLPLNVWECVLRKDDSSLVMHIPSGGGMTPESCAASLTEAAALFARQFPAERPRAVVCISWIFSPLLQEILPATANLCTFQRNLFLFPVASGPWDGLWFVFLQHGELDLNTVPRDTSVQRGIAGYLKQGHRWRVAGMFILLDDIPEFGRELYLSEWTPEI